MQSIGAFQAKTHFSSLLEKVEKGEQVIITKRGLAVARIIPFKKNDNEQRRQAILKLKEFSKQNTLGNLDWKTLRDEGRR